jgi:hypothetical protein
MKNVARRLCSVDGCGRPHRARGLCSTHYFRQQKGIDLAPPVRPFYGPTCSVGGCGLPHDSRGLCKMHARRLRASGTVELTHVAAKIAGENWRAVPGYEGRYEVSDHGRVRSLDREIVRRSGARYWHVGRVLIAGANLDGYPMAQLEGKRFGVHVLVAAAFIGPRPEGMQVNHKNGVKTDNRPPNLEYVTASENVKHAFATGLATAARGEANGKARLTAGEAAYAKRAPGTNAEVAAELGVSRCTVDAIRKGRNWRHLP